MGQIKKFKISKGVYHGARAGKSYRVFFYNIRNDCVLVEDYYGSIQKVKKIAEKKLKSFQSEDV